MLLANTQDAIAILLTLLCPLSAGAVGLLLFVFWIWMLVDCLQNERLQGNDKLVWVLVVVLLHFLGALIYFFVERPKGR